MTLGFCDIQHEKVYTSIHFNMIALLESLVVLKGIEGGSVHHYSYIKGYNFVIP